MFRYKLNTLLTQDGLGFRERRSWLVPILWVFTELLGINYNALDSRHTEIILLKILAVRTYNIGHIMHQTAIVNPGIRKEEVLKKI